MSDSSLDDPEYFSVGDVDPWQQTPWWHPFYWFGWRVRRWDWRRSYHPVDGEWRYTTHKKHALKVLAGINQ